DEDPPASLTALNRPPGALETGQAGRYGAEQGILREIARLLMAEKTFELVTYEKSNRIAWITIRNESRMNALSTGVLNGLYDSFEEADNDDEVLVTVLTGAGGRAFCAGMDLKEMTERDQAGTAPTAKNGFGAVSSTLKPVIGAVDGFALAGGMQ